MSEKRQMQEEEGGTRKMKREGRRVRESQEQKLVICLWSINNCKGYLSLLNLEIYYPEANCRDQNAESHWLRVFLKLRFPPEDSDPGWQAVSFGKGGQKPTSCQLPDSLPRS